MACLSDEQMLNTYNAVVPLSALKNLLSERAFYHSVFRHRFAFLFQPLHLIAHPCHLARLPGMQDTAESIAPENNRQDSCARCFWCLAGPPGEASLLMVSPLPLHYRKRDHLLFEGREAAARYDFDTASIRHMYFHLHGNVANAMWYTFV